MLKNKLIRTVITRQSHYWFFHYYFCDYVKYKTANFQKEIIALTENEDIKNLIIVSFRDSAKSTLVTLSYAIWSIIGKQQKKFVVILSQTQRQARQHLANIKQELENNERLKKDLGPFEEHTDEWGSYSLVLSKYGARISAASAEQSIRGLRHAQHRPDLIIADDVEDLASVRTQEARDKTFKWFTGDVRPAGGLNTKIVIVGNLLHDDSLIMRFKRAIEEKHLQGAFKAYPLVNESGKILWPGKFPNQAAIEDLRQRIGDEIAFQREYMLKIVPETDVVIDFNWVHYFERFPEKDPDNSPYYIIAGVDLAIGEKETNDYTAIVISRVYGRGKNMKIYVDRIINKRMDFPTTRNLIKQLFESYNKSGLSMKMYIEDAGYQRAIIQDLQKEGYAVEGVPTGGLDKRSRLTMITPAIKDGAILFPKKGCELLINQLLGFGSEKHDDLVDAFVMFVMKIIEKNRGTNGSLDWMDDDKGPRPSIGYQGMGNLLNKKF